MYKIDKIVSEIEVFIEVKVGRAIFEYGAGGNEVRIDVSEAIADIPFSKALLVLFLGILFLLLCIFPRLKAFASSFACLFHVLPHWTHKKVLFFIVKKALMQRYRSLGWLPFRQIDQKMYYLQSEVETFIREHFENRYKSKK